MSILRCDLISPALISFRLFLSAVPHRAQPALSMHTTCTSQPKQPLVESSVIYKQDFFVQLTVPVPRLSRGKKVLIFKIFPFG